jgi:hypothetical protein
MSFRIIAAGAGMLAAFTLAATTTAPAQTAGSNASASSTQTRAAKPLHRAAKPQREAAKARRVKRARLAARHRHRPMAEVDIESVPRPTARAETTVAVRQQTAGARRFREFLIPQSFAGVANEELRGPRLSAAQLSGEIADPEVAVVTTPEAVAAEAPKGAPPIFASDQTTTDESANKAAATALGDPVQVRRAAPAEKGPGGMSFLSWFFIAWGGVLTFASAVRMAVG